MSPRFRPGNFAVLMCLVLVAGAGCATLVVTPPVLSAPLRPTETWRAGAAKVDLTPMPGFPMGGHSLAGETARGYWTRLHANAIFLEDPDGRRLALVSCDLWAMPAGLADRVAELVASNPEGRPYVREGIVLARDQLVIAATHTHQSPGNFSSAPAYNVLASPSPGFDPRLFEFLAHRISDAILAAARAARPATVTYAEGPVTGLARSRSFTPFLQDAEAPPILAANAWLPVDAVPRAYLPPPPPYEPWVIYRAVLPRLAVLSMHAPDDPAAILAIAAFVAAHPTSVSARTPLYTSDFFGVAARIAEHALRKGASSRPPVVAIFNGAEGDVSPAWQCRERDGQETCQDRADALALGRVLGSRIAELTREGRPLSGRMESRFAGSVQLAGQCVLDQPSLCTAKEPMVGVAMVGGAPDGRSVAHAQGWREGVTGPDTPDQGPKRPALDPGLVSAASPVGLSRFVVKALSIPRTAPLGLYRIGPVLLATVPGEFSTVMGLRIERALAQAMADSGRPVERVIVIGLANEYMSYFTTPEEYALQWYEGASTLYGPASGPLIQDRLTLLARQFAEAPAPDPRTIEYVPGPIVRFGLCDVASAASSRKGLDGMLQDAAGDPLTDAPMFCWSDRRPFLPSSFPSDRRVTPSVRIEVRRGNGAWAPLTTAESGEESDQGINFITTASATFPIRSQWCVTWLGNVPDGADVEARFHVTTLGGVSLYGPVRRGTSEQRAGP